MSLDFCINYEKPVCPVCRCRIVRHTRTPKAWKFVCITCGYVYPREVINELDAEQFGVQGEEPQ